MKVGELDHFFGVGKARTRKKPRRILVVALPRGVGTLDVIGDLKFMALLAKPVRQLIPLAQQAFQGDLDHNLAVALVLH